MDEKQKKKIETYNVKSVTQSVWYNLAGQRTESPGFSSTVVTTNAYNTKGQLYRSYLPGYGSSSAQYVIALQSAPERTLTYQYVPSGNGVGQIQTISENSNSVRSYTYTPVGQVASITEKIDNIDYTTSYLYNNYGQITENQSPSGMRVGYQYNNGILTAMRNADNNALLWQANGMNALGQITGSMLGNGLQRISGYDTYHFLNQIQLEDGNTVIDNVDYSFNPTTGNVTSRNDITNSRNELFGYDVLNRLDSIRLNSGIQNKTTYSPNGNINTKYDVGTYQYANNSHAVSGISNPVSGYNPPAFTLSSTSYNRPSLLTQQGSPTKKLEFEYNADNQRKKTLYYENNVLEKTMYYVGNYEKEVIEGGDTNEYDYIYSPEGLAAISVKIGGVRTMYYAHVDHLGSLRVVTTAAKAIQSRYLYDAWGTRILITGTGITNRGFTGHEHLPEFGFINMNARLYDPVLGRFLAMDPFVQMPDYTQGFNRYSYAMNNPLIYTDPDGEWIHIPILAVIGGVLNVLSNLDNIDGFWQGFAAFNVGAGQGALTAVFPAAGAIAGTAITSATNNLIGQTGNNFSGINQVNWGQVGVSGILGAANGAFSMISPIQIPFGESGFGLTIAPQIAIGTDGFGVGVNATFGYNYKGFNAGVNFGGSYYASATGTGNSGFEGRIGYGIGYQGKHFHAGLGSTYFFSGETSQLSGQMYAGGGKWRVTYENDTWIPLPGLTHGDPAHDRFRTAAVRFDITGGRLKGLNAGMNIFTGLADRYSENGIFDGPGADKYRMGALYLGYGNARIGMNSERLRSAVQNGFHDMFNYPHFRELNIPTRLYFGFYSPNPYTVW